MNRWKTKKKANKEAEAAARPSTDSDPPPVPTLKSSKTFRLGRKAPEPEVKREEFILENALPSSDDFRTSLLMSGLSARFSMLREQDDPKSKIGKASDDSVLFPKRQSRLNDFGFQSHGLSDIAEVSSIHGSIRPPFAFSRTDSYHEGYGTDDDQGSIMSRKKPTEGNNLFGGRQKIYKLAGNSSSTTTGADSTSGGMGGRALYGDDVSQSAFQKLREREREQQRAEPEEELPSRSTSPIMTGYNRNRETSSTTTSTTRSSTAATSVTSQRTPSLSGPHNSANPNVTKGRRLYENGLDQQLHEQQHSAMSRIDTLTRQRTLGAQTPPPGLSSPVGGTTGNDRWERHPIAGKQSMPNLRTTSPTITPLSTFDFGVKPINTPDSKSFGASSPLSPPISEHDDGPVLPLQTNDRTKVAALGPFSKPAGAYDENKYSQRQLQMASGRETPPLRKQSPPRAFPVRPPPQLQAQIPRNRADSNVVLPPNRSRANSSAARPFLPHERTTESSPINHQAPVLEESPVSSGTFLDTSEPSTSNDNAPQTRLPTPADIYKMHRAVPKTTLERPPESQHPALRQQAFGQPPPIQIQSPYQRDAFGNTDSRTPTIPILTPALSPSNLATPLVESPADSPTLGPASGLDSIRQHLRSDSNSSSVYSTMQSAGLVSRFPEHNEHDDMPDNAYTVKDNAWDNGDWDRGYEADYGGKYVEKSSPKKNENALSPLSVRSNNIEPASQVDATPSWEQEISGTHVRTASSATQQEQQEFQNELAFRRRQIKENMKSFVETESRSASPGPGIDSPRDYSAIKNPALNLLKSKTSRGSLVGKQNQNGQSKAMKMLGIGGPSNSDTSSPVKQGWEDNMWKQEEEDMLRGAPKNAVSPPQTKAFRQARRDAQRDRERLLAQRPHQNQRPSVEGNDSQWNGEIKPVQRMASNDRFPSNIRTDPREMSRDRKPPPVAYTQRNESSTEGGSRAASRSSRDRSSSDASTRSKSRNGRYKDDLAKAMADGTSTATQSYDDLEVPPTRFMPRSPGTPNMYQNSPIPSPLPGTPARSRSNSTLPQAGYFEPSQKVPAMHINTEIDHITPRPSPAFVVNPTPSLMQPSPVPSAANTPTTQGFQSKLPAPRKRSINKHEISEPKLISSTSRITTVNLPPGSSLQNGIEPHSAPPIPPVNPRRRQTRAMFGFGRKEEIEELHAMPAATQSTEEMSTFSADEGDKPRSRQKLRKSSSEGGNLNARARQAAFAAPSPALPTGTFPPGSGSPPRRPTEGGMF